MIIYSLQQIHEKAIEFGAECCIHDSFVFRDINAAEKFSKWMNEYWQQLLKEETEKLKAR